MTTKPKTRKAAAVPVMLISVDEGMLLSAIDSLDACSPLLEAAYMAAESMGDIRGAITAVIHRAQQELDAAYAIINDVHELARKREAA